MWMEISGHTWESSRKSLGNVLNALNWVPVKKKKMVEMANVMFCVFYSKKKFR